MGVALQARAKDAVEQGIIAHCGVSCNIKRLQQELILNVWKALREKLKFKVIM